MAPAVTSSGTSCLRNDSPKPTLALGRVGVGARWVGGWGWKNGLGWGGMGGVSLARFFGQHDVSEIFSTYSLDTTADVRIRKDRLGTGAPNDLEFRLQRVAVGRR